jgi:predicted PurR-regulated permease PerM
MGERLIRERIFFFILVIVLAALALVLIWPFVEAILFSVAIVVIMKPLYNWFLKKRWIRGVESRATAATIITFILVIAIPIALIVGSAISQAANLFGGLEIEGVDFSLSSIIAWIEGAIQSAGGGGIQVDELQIAESVQGAFDAITDFLGQALISLGQSLPQMFTSALIILVMMGVLLPRYRRPGEDTILELVPFPPEITQLFLDKVDMMITAMFKGTFVIAIVQGGIMGVVFWIAGVPYVTLLTILSMFLSLVPLIGISLVAWPVAILLLIMGQVWQGVFVLVAFLIVVSNIDTVLRPRLVPRGAYLNPALVILSVFGGMQLMGIIGALYGPVIMILLITSVDVYLKYMLRSDLKALQEQGRINLEELGLVPEEIEADGKGGEMLATAARRLVARFRQGPKDPEGQVSA